jgi:hypothetical protein
MSNTFIPFDNNPASVVALTSSGYTVPSGKYARVTGRIYLGAIAVNGTNVFYGTATSALLDSGSTSSTSTSQITLITVPSGVAGVTYFSYSWSTGAAGYTLTIRHIRSGGTQWTATDSSSTSTQSGSYYLSVLPGDTITAQHSATANYARNFYLYGLNTAWADFDFWAPAGTVITTVGSGLGTVITGQVQVYNVIS